MHVCLLVNQWARHFRICCAVPIQYIFFLTMNSGTSNNWAITAKIIKVSSLAINFTWSTSCWMKTSLRSILFIWDFFNSDSTVCSNRVALPRAVGISSPSNWVKTWREKLHDFSYMRDPFSVPTGIINNELNYFCLHFIWKKQINSEKTINTLDSLHW